MKRILYFIFFFSSTLFPNEKNELELKNCILIGLEQNPEIKQKLWYEISKKNALEQTYSDFYPKLNFQYGYNKQSIQSKNETPITKKNYFATIEVLQNLYNQNSVTKIDIAKEELFISQLELKKQKENIVFNIIQTYLTILIFLENIKASEENLNFYKQYVEMIQKFIEVGLRTHNELLKANAELKNAEVELAKIKNQFNLSKLQLVFYMGLLKENQNVDLENFNIKKIEPEELLSYFNTKKEIVINALNKINHIKELYEIALVERKDYQIQRKQIELSKLGINLQKSGYYPLLGASFTYSQVDDYFHLRSPENKNWNLSLFIKIPLFEGFLTKNKIEEYESLFQIQLEKENLLKQSIALELESNFNNYKELEKKIQFYKESYKYAKENLNLVQKRYNNGLGTFLELTDATNLYYTSSKNLIQAKYEIELKKIEILKSLGIILEIL